MLTVIGVDRTDECSAPSPEHVRFPKLACPPPMLGNRKKASARCARWPGGTPASINRRAPGRGPYSTHSVTARDGEMAAARGDYKPTRPTSPR